MSESLEDFYTVEEATARLRISESTLRTWVSEGKINYHTLGQKLVRFNDDDLRSAFVFHAAQAHTHVSPQTPTRRRRRRQLAPPTDR